MGRHKPRRGKATKKARAGVKVTPGEAADGCATFVFHKGKVAKNVQQLVRDMRRLMEPFTASRLKVRKNNVIKDFVSAAGVFSVSHLVAFTQSETTLYMKLIRIPRGPTLTFRICSYSLTRDVTASLKTPHMEPKQFLYHPLVVMNNFSGKGMEFKLMTSMFQNMFPSINVEKVDLNHLRRCVVLNYNAEDQTIDFTHCNIQVSPVGLSKPVKKLIKAKVPDMSSYADIAEYMTRDGNLSESEGEMDGPANEVTLPQKLTSRGNVEAGKSAIKMHEIGPRLIMKLHKIEEGICDGEILFHDLFNKTDEEILKLKKEKEDRQQLKEERRKRQEENVRLKAARKRRSEKSSSDTKSVQRDESHTALDTSEDDDNDYFEKEVGVKPDPDVLKKAKKRPAASRGNNKRFKKFKQGGSVEKKESKTPANPFKKHLRKGKNIRH